MLSLAPDPVTFTLPQQAPVEEAVGVYAEDCATPKTAFTLGETVCVIVAGSPLGKRRINWVNAGGYVLQKTRIQEDPYTASFELPTTVTSNVGGIIVDNRGTWKINNTSTSDASVRARAIFTVSDPANAATDLSIINTGLGTEESPVAADADVIYYLTVTNRGPDTAQNVQVSNPSPANTTFVSASQEEGPAFTCANPNAGSAGTTTCTIAQLAKGETAIFRLTYHINTGASNGTIISDTATVSSATTERHQPDNTATTTNTVSALACRIECPDDITVPHEANSGGAVVNYPAATTSGGTCDNLQYSHPTNSFFPIGTTVVSVTSDTGSPCSFTVTVTDSDAPTISCPADVTAQESSPGSGSANVTYPDPTVTDADPNVTINCDKPSGSSFNVGTTPVTCNATDSSGNVSQNCTFNVTVTGQGGGCAIFCPTDITKDVDPGSCSAVVTYDAPTTDSCTGETVTQTAGLASGSAFPVGTTINTFQVTDSSNVTRTCSFKVTVVDNEAPVITCPDDITVNAEGSSCSATVNLVAPTATDNCAAPVTVTGVRSNSRPLNEPYTAGNTTITWTATDAAGNTTSCEQTITVKDNTPPTVAVNVPDELVNDLLKASVNESCQAEIPDLVQYAIPADNCTPLASLTVLQSPAPGTLVGPGQHSITITVIEGDPDGEHNSVSANTLNGVEKVFDANGNVSFIIKRTLNMVVNVTDDTAPTITAPADAAYQCVSEVPAPDGSQATAADNCGTVEVTVADTTSGSGSTASPLVITRTYTATDAAGKTASDVQAITVIDTTAPVLTLNGDSPMTVECHAAFVDPGASASDNCGGDLSGSIVVTGSVDPNTVGSYTLTYSITDAASNTTTATRTVNVVDTTAPAISCPADVVVYLPLNSTDTSMAVNYPQVTATESCSTANVVSNPAAGSVFQLGTTTVNATATDEAGNSSSCSFTVTVLYNFTGFFSPVSNLPVVNVVNAGKAIPVKFSLSGNKGMNIFATGYPASGTVACNSSDPAVDLNATVTAGQSSLSYDASSDQYVYVWKTESSWVGTCRQLVIQLNDGSIHRANFRFK